MNIDLLKEPIIKMLMKMAIPMSWGILSVIGFNLADMYFIAKLGKVELAAISLTFPVVMFFISIALGVATAISSIVSRSFGENELDKVKRYTSDGLTFALLLVIFLSIIGYISIDPLFTLLGANLNTLPLVKEYMEIWYFGMIFIAVPIAGNGAIRAKGDMKNASLIMFVGALTNIILDPIFIFGYFGIPALGMKGAAIATVIARGITLIASILLLHYKYQMLDFRIPKFQDALSSWRKILFIAVPATGANIINPIVLFFVTSIVARFGEISVAAFGVVSKVESFAMIFIMAISSSMGPIVGQNFGAKKYSRIINSMDISFFISITWGLIMYLILFLIGDNIMALFNKDHQLIAIGNLYFKLVPLSFGFFGIRSIVCSSLNAVGKPFLATALIMFTLICIYLPSVILGSKYSGIQGIFIAQTISNLFAGLLSLYIIRRVLKKNSTQVFNPL